MFGVSLFVRLISVRSGSVFLLLRFYDSGESCHYATYDIIYPLYIKIEVLLECMHASCLGYLVVFLCSVGHLVS